MKFTCNKEVLLKEISIAQEIISSKNAILILSNIYLEAVNNKLIIKAKDMKVNFQTEVPVNVLEEGSTTVYCDKFFGVIGTFPYDEMEFSLKNNVAVIKPVNQKKPEYKLKSIASEKFPEVQIISKSSFEMPIKDFKEMISQTIFSISDDETRYFMNGVLFEKDQNKFVMVGTDGRRLSLARKDAPDSVKDFSAIIIPPKILSIVLRRSGDEGLVGITIKENMIFINFASYYFSSMLIEGNFPNYKKVIPEDQELFLTVKREEFLQALRRVSLMVEKKSHRIFLDIFPGRMIVASEESDIGTVEDEIPCCYDGEELKLPLNYVYMEDPFKTMTDEEIKIKFYKENPDVDRRKAITIEPNPAKEYFHIVMPMQY